MRVSPLIQHWAFLAVFIAAPCLAATEIRVYSEDGDFVGKGGTYVFPEDEGDWIIEGEAHFARISWWNLPQQVFSFTFEDWTSPRLLPGRYDVEVQDSRSPPTGPTMSISGNNSSCSPGVGYYEIYEIETGPDDVITKIAVDAYQRCDNSTRGLFAEVRYNSDIAFDLGVRVRAVDDFVTPPGAPVDVGLDFASSSSGPITTFEWKQVGGDPVALAGADSDTLSFTAPVSDAEYEALVFQITVTDSIGETATDNVTVISSAIGTVSMGYMLKSAPGSYIGGGRTEEAAIDEQYLNIIHDHDKTIVNYEPPDGSGWEMQIAADFGQDLQIGQYNVAHRAPFRPENFPGAAFGITGRGCNSLLADFKVLDIGYADNKAVERLAVDMVLGCLSGNDNSVDFRLRVNSVVPIFSNAPIADPGRDLMALPNDVVHLDAYATQNDFGSIASYEWSQTLGPPVTLFDSGSSVARFVAPDVVQGQGLSRFELTVVNDAGLSDAESVEVNILGTNDRKTYITLESSVPDFRLNRRLDQNTGYLFAHEPQNGFDIHFIALLDWGFAFRQLHDPGNTVPDLLPGLYEQAQRSVPGFPHMYISGAGHGCSQELGSFVVHEITRDADGEPDSVAIDFESHCDFEPPLKGKIRINSTVPDDAPGLFASAGQDIDALEDQLVELNAEGSYIGPTAGASYQWQQISGPPVVIMDDTQPVASFVAPGGAGVAVFQVTITTAEGLTATATVSVNLLGSGALTSGLYLESTTGEPFLEGKTIYFGPGYPPNSSFQSDRLTVSNNGGPQFRLFLKAADGNPLLPGDYANAFGLYELESQNGIDFRPGQSSCDSAVGWFRIYEIVPSADQKEVDKLAADFWQSCEYGDSPIHGAIRINSSIPFTTVAPVATAGPNAVARAGTEVTLDAAQSFSWNSSVSNYVWKQLSGPAAAISGANTATPRIALPPSTGQTEYLEFEVSVRNDFGQVDKARATVTSLSEADPTSELIVSLFDLNTRQEFFSTKFDIANSYFDYSGTVSGMKVDVFNRDIGLRFSLSQASDQFPVGSKVYHQYSGRDQTFPDFNTNEFPIFRCFGSHDGWLHVRDIVVNDDVIESIAYEIEQACENGFGVRTSARFDSTVPLDKGNVVTIQAADMTVEEGSTVDLYDVIAYIEGEVARDVSWQHLGGPQPFLATYPSARTVFVAPNVDSDEVVRLQLELTSWAGQTYTDEIEVTVVDNGISGMPAGLISTSTATGTYQATGNAIAVDSNQLIRLETHSPNVVSGPFEPDVAPFGTMTLEFQVPADGDSTNATIYFQQPLPANSSWLIHDDYGGWLMYDGTWSIAPDRQSIRFEIADGGPGDLDFRVDKRVLITGGIGASQPALPPPPPPPPAPQPTGGGGGGSMAPVTLLVFFVLIFNRRCRARMNIAAPVLR